MIGRHILLKSWYAEPVKFPNYAEDSLEHFLYSYEHGQKNPFSLVLISSFWSRIVALIKQERNILLLSTVIVNKPAEFTKSNQFN